MDKRKISGRRHLTPDDVRAVRKRAQAGETYQEIAKDYPLHWTNIGRVVRMEYYKNVK